MLEPYTIQHRAGAQGIYVQVRKDSVTMDFLCIIDTARNNRVKSSHHDWLTWEYRYFFRTHSANENLFKAYNNYRSNTLTLIVTLKYKEKRGRGATPRADLAPSWTSVPTRVRCCIQHLFSIEQKTEQWRGSPGKENSPPSLSSYTRSHSNSHHVTWKN